jgi:subtilisin family serine protease
VSAVVHAGGPERPLDIFAPGSDIFSTVPGDKYDYKSGSSMSAPIVTAVAALLLEYFPALSAQQVKEILMRSSFKPAVVVNRPGTQQKVPFRSLSVGGGIVNAYNAVLEALAGDGEGSVAHRTATSADRMIAAGAARLRRLDRQR